MISIEIFFYRVFKNYSSWVLGNGMLGLNIVNNYVDKFYRISRGNWIYLIFWMFKFEILIYLIWFLCLKIDLLMLYIIIIFF